MDNNIKTCKVEFRVTKDDLKYLKIASYVMGQTVSGMVRLMAQSTINSVKLQINQGKIKIEDFKTILDD